MKPALRSVKPDEKPTPAQAWLSLSAEIRMCEQRLFRLQSERRSLKPEIMRGMRKWGLSDELVTAELERA